MREIIVYSSREGSTNKVQSAATTWGQLKSDLQAQGINANELKAIVRETKTTLELDSAQLPEGTFTVFLSPGKKNSSGSDFHFDEMSLDQLRRFAGKVGVSQIGGATSIANRLNAWLSETGGSSINPVEEAINDMQDKIDNLLGIQKEVKALVAEAEVQVEELKADIKDIVETTNPVSNLSREYEAISRELGF